MLQQNKAIWNNMVIVTVLQEQFIFLATAADLNTCNHSKSATLGGSASN